MLFTRVLKSHCWDLDLNDQKTRRYFWQWFHIQKPNSSPNLIQVIVLRFKFSRPFKVNTQVLTLISQCWESVKHQLASDEGENRKRIVMSSLWMKNTLYYKKDRMNFWSACGQSYTLLCMPSLKFISWTNSN